VCEDLASGVRVFLVAVKAFENDDVKDLLPELLSGCFGEKSLGAVGEFMKPLLDAVGQIRDVIHTRVEKCVVQLIGYLLKTNAAERSKIMEEPWMVRALENEQVRKSLSVLKWLGEEGKCERSFGDLQNLHKHVGYLVSLNNVDKHVLDTFGSVDDRQAFAARAKEVDSSLATVFTTWEEKVNRLDLLAAPFRLVREAAASWTMHDLEYLFIDSTESSRDRKELQMIFEDLREAGKLIPAIVHAPPFHASQAGYKSRQEIAATLVKEVALLLATFSFSAVFMQPGEYPDQKSACERMRKYAATLFVSVSGLPGALQEAVKNAMIDQPRSSGQGPLSERLGGDDVGEKNTSDQAAIAVERGSGVKIREEKQEDSKKEKKHEKSSAGKSEKGDKKEKSKKEKKGKSKKEKKEKSKHKDEYSVNAKKQKTK
jgi:hypothetical protein